MNSISLLFHRFMIDVNNYTQYPVENCKLKPVLIDICQLDAYLFYFYTVFLKKNNCEI